ncbi:MAG: hypothetical protein RBR02_06285 [Desulfuromonadaceae bacterium]|nr:hypothetical protein [Desulfuromonadaceae bacterium]
MTKEELKIALYNTLILLEQYSNKTDEYIAREIGMTYKEYIKIKSI